MALKGMKQQWGGSKQLEGGSFKFVTPSPKHEGKLGGGATDDSLYE